MQVSSAKSAAEVRAGIYGQQEKAEQLKQEQQEPTIIRVVKPPVNPPPAVHAVSPFPARPNLRINDTFTLASHAPAYGAALEAMERHVADVLAAVQEMRQVYETSMAHANLEAPHQVLLTMNSQVNRVFKLMAPMNFAPFAPALQNALSACRSDLSQRAEERERRRQAAAAAAAAAAAQEAAERAEADRLRGLLAKYPQE